MFYIGIFTSVGAEGNWPRNIGITPDEKRILVANKKSNNITVFRVDKDSGLHRFLVVLA